MPVTITGCSRLFLGLSFVVFIRKGNEEVPEDYVVLPPTSHLEASNLLLEIIQHIYVLRLIQWLEGLASKALDLENKNNPLSWQSTIGIIGVAFGSAEKSLVFKLSKPFAFAANVILGDAKKEVKA